MQVYRLLVVSSVLALLLPFFIERCFAARRVALVIGNAGYKTGPLNNPVNDARDIASVLESYGFDVIKQFDVTKEQMLASISSFSDTLAKSEVGLFYYAGHGMQINGHNYLIPVGARVEIESDIEFGAVDMGRIIARMSSAGTRLNVVILDACRNNPFISSFRSSSPGLARMEAPRGTIIVYATGPGAVAADGKGSNGIFTKHLLDSMRKPELDIQDVFNEAGMRVMEETDDRQVPWISNTPIPRYYLAGGTSMVEEPSPPNKRIATPGSLKIRSVPSGALVSIDGKKIKTTPLLLEELPEGSVLVRVEKEGFYAEEKKITIKAGQRISLTFDLSEGTRTGWLTVASVPLGAQVRVVGVDAQYAPGMELNPGRYEVEVFSEGYESKTREVELEAGEELDIQVALKPLGLASPFQVSRTGNTEAGKSHTDLATGTELVWVEGGCFQMGDTFGEGVSGEQPVHEVCLDGFYIGKYEVTQGEYTGIMGKNPSKSRRGDRYPVEMVSWNDAQSFINRLNQRANTGYRLPTEAEWEYAARSGGKKEMYAGGNDPDPVAWYPGWREGTGTSGGKAHQVGRKRANGLGIYDMSGNVAEWCLDWYGEDYYSKSSYFNPPGPASGSERVVRGGGFAVFMMVFGSANKALGVRAALRDKNTEMHVDQEKGFRLVLPDQGR